MFSAPRSRQEQGRREQSSARGGRRGGAASRGQGGPRVTADEEEKSAFPISSPRFYPPPPRSFSPSEALGCESHFLSSRQNGPHVSGGGGERVGREAAAGSRFIFHPGFLLAAFMGGRGEESKGRPQRGELGGRPPVPARFLARACRRDCPFPAT